MRYLPLVLASFALSSCWTGTDLYSASDSRAAIPPGVYQVTIPDEQARAARISILSNGLTQFDWGDEKDSRGFAPLDPDQRTFVMWSEIEPGQSAPKKFGEPNQIYELMVRRSDDDFVVYLPDCNEAGAEVARNAGAAIQPGTVPTCIFPTRASLEAALRRVPKGAESMRIKRIP